MISLQSILEPCVHSATRCRHRCCVLLLPRHSQGQDPTSQHGGVTVVQVPEASAGRECLSGIPLAGVGRAVTAEIPAVFSDCDAGREDATI